MIAFSIIIPTHNRPILLRRALDSALLAVSGDDEILVIDDGSNVSYEDVLLSYTDPRLRYFKITAAGVSAARNHGMEQASYDFIAFLDDDDEWGADHLNFHRAVYQQYTDLAAVFTNFDNTDPQGTFLRDGLSRWARDKPKPSELLTEVPVKGIPDNIRVYRGYQYRNQLTTDYILPSSLSINTRVVGKSNRFRIGLHRNQSWLFSSRMCSFGDVAYIDVCSVIQHGDATTRATHLPLFNTVLSRLYVMAEEWGKNPEFLRRDGALYRDTYLMDFAVALKAALRDLSVYKLTQLFGQVGYIRSMRLCVQAIPYLLNRKKLRARSA